MLPYFVTAERQKKDKAKNKKKKDFFEKLIRKKYKKYSIVNNNNKIICAWYLREAPGQHTYLKKKTGIFPLKIVRN